MSAVTDTLPETSVPDEERLFTAEEAIERMHLAGIKSARWLKDQARADRLYFTPVGKTLMWSAQDIRDNIARMRHAPRNKFQP